MSSDVWPAFVASLVEELNKGTPAGFYPGATPPNAVMDGRLTFVEMGGGKIHGPVYCYYGERHRIVNGACGVCGTPVRTD
jgi:hypothetical protein